MQEIKPVIRSLEREDIPQIADAFQRLGWNKPATQYERYLDEQAQSARRVYVAFVEAKFAGYLTICWDSDYGPFREERIPEIVDFNVLPEFRRHRIGTLLMDQAEREIAGIHPVVGIGVGMTPDYGAAQRLYVLRGYIPDGRGLHFHDHHVRYGENVTVNDDLVLYFTKKLSST